MSTGKRRSYRDEFIATLRDQETIIQFTNAQALLKPHLIHTREIPNGRDFLFLGPQKDLQDALKVIVDVEHKSSRFFHVDFAQVDQYVLFRVVGSESDQKVIAGYFE